MQQPLILYQMEIVPVPITDKKHRHTLKENDRQIDKPYIALNSETYRAQVPIDLPKPLHHGRPQFPKRQFKVRVVEKSLPVNTEPEVVATAATSTQTSVVKSTTTAAKPSSIPLTVYYPAKIK